ncbi:V-type ATP synthase subunit I [Desnuesiella massiliensis]|uniref:V-type ATP synthase subunit I n=1 Tax=Desnuesiella massiliensis TaxID=1650662 RepID=UPI0006E2E86A|nr:V-type ATPase 116kDa subunit family protein [Desnuesiella massiliensis]
MSIEKMYMVNLVGAFKDFDRLTKLLALGSFIQPVNALQEINSSDFVLKTSEDNIEALMDVSYIRPYVYEKDYNVGLRHIEKLRKQQKDFKLEEKIIKDVIFDFEDIEHRTEEIYRRYKTLNKELEALREKEQFLKNTYEALDFLKDVSLPIEDVVSMKNFKVGLYKVNQENMDKIKANYENIPSVVQSVYKEKDFVIFIAFTPIPLIAETERIFKSANCEEILLPNHYAGTPIEVVEALKKETKEYFSLTEVSERKLKDFLVENYDSIKTLENSYELEQKSADIKKTAACTNEFFYLSGWVPETLMHKLDNTLVEFKDTIVTLKKDTKEINNKSIIPPTKLKNGKLIRPFESMVGMYGTPTYGEIDPTAFLAITYTIMFGAMFGDVGQGAVLLLGGLYLRFKKKRTSLGGILERLGVSSMIFGFLYGSIFGSEELIPALLVRPMEDIQDVLLWAIIFGCGFLIFGFLLGIINNLRKGDIEHGVFGKEGIAGFLFYIGALVLVVSKVYGKDILPVGVWAVYLISLLLLILLKQPLAHICMGKKTLFEEGPKDYFIEASFEVIETLLSMFSNTVSFIRVGAFALNHVGLFIAFSAMAHMSKSGVSSALILILGNIIIIGLEGLIVFIQGLRLQYYELFSKYYEGGGVPFEPVTVNF